MDVPPYLYFTMLLSYNLENMTLTIEMYKNFVKHNAYHNHYNS